MKTILAIGVFVLLTAQAFGISLNQWCEENVGPPQRNWNGSEWDMESAQTQANFTCLRRGSRCSRVHGFKIGTSEWIECLKGSD